MSVLLELRWLGAANAFHNGVHATIALITEIRSQAGMAWRIGGIVREGQLLEPELRRLLDYTQLGVMPSSPAGRVLLIHPSAAHGGHSDLGPLLAHPGVYSVAMLNVPGEGQRPTKGLADDLWLAAYDLYLAGSVDAELELQGRFDVPSQDIVAHGDGQSGTWEVIRTRYDDWRACREALAVTRPRLALITTWPPQQSGVADYSMRTAAALAPFAEIDVFTDEQSPAAHPAVRDFMPISLHPYLSGDYDAVVAVLGNHPWHARIHENAARFGGAALMHDPNVIGFREGTYGLANTAAYASRLLNREVGQSEIVAWRQKPETAQVTGFEDVAAVAVPFFVHAPQLLSPLEASGVAAAHLPACVPGQLDDAALARDEREASRSRLGMPAGRVVVCTFGIMTSFKGVSECVFAVEQLRAWGIEAELWFAGSTAIVEEELAGAVGSAGLQQFVHRAGDWMPQETYRDYLLAADFAIQLRRGAAGGLSAALLDCIEAGIPTVASADLAATVEAPEYVMRVPDVPSPLLIAEQIANVLERGDGRERCSAARTAYIAGHNFDVYAARLASALGLGEARG